MPGYQEVGFQTLQESYHPNELLEQARLIEDVGFDSIWTSDHFHPWFDTDAHSGFAWLWLAAAGQVTDDVSLGTAVTPILKRYHPGLVAQAFGTLQAMYPGRARLGVGTGEAMNTIPLGYDWPEYPERRERTREGLKVLRKLWDEDGFQSYDGEFWSLNEAKLYTNPDPSPPIYMSAFGPQSASVAGEYADALWTIGQPEQDRIDALKRGLRKGAERADRDPDDIELVLEIPFALGDDREELVEECRRWGGNAMDIFFDQGIADPRVIERHGRMLREEVLEDTFFITTETEPIVEVALDYADEFDSIVFSNKSPDPLPAIEQLGDEVVSEVRK